MLNGMKGHLRFLLANYIINISLLAHIIGKRNYFLVS